MAAARGHQKCVWPEHAVPPEKFLEPWIPYPHYCPKTITPSWHKVQALTRWNKRLSGWMGCSTAYSPDSWATVFMFGSYFALFSLQTTVSSSGGSSSGIPKAPRRREKAKARRQLG